MALIVAMSTHADVEMGEHERRDYATRLRLANGRGALECGVAVDSPQHL
jgi:hypothetical protein